LLKRQGALVSALIMALALLGHYLKNREWLDRYSPYQLPAFDAYVYVAMAEHPGFFTVPPWGFRVLGPWLAHLLPAASVVQAFGVLSFGCLGLAGVLLFFYLRRLGHGVWACWLAVAAFGLSGPVGEVASHVFLAEPVSLVLELAFLLAVEAGAGVGVMALLAVLGALSKEILIALIPVVYFARRDRDGDRRALMQAVLVAIPALLAAGLLRARWAPHLATEPAWSLGLERLQTIANLIGSSWGGWLGLALLGGMTPVALLGALRRGCRPFLRRYGYVLLVTVLLGFFTPYAYALRYLQAELRRLLIYALPVLLPLCLWALDRVLPHWEAPADPRPPLPAWRLLAGVSAAGLVALPLLVVDPYRRSDLRGLRDGPFVLAYCRGTLSRATQLDRGRPLYFQLQKLRYAPDRMEPSRLDSMRWFLKGGWDPHPPQYSVEEVVMSGQTASLVLPCLRPRDLELTLAMSTVAAARLGIRINAQAVATVSLEQGFGRYSVSIPAASLFRGDNEILLVAPADLPRGVRLHSFTVRPAGTRG
jgi:hypothetical protein